MKQARRRREEADSRYQRPQGVCSWYHSRQSEQGSGARVCNRSGGRGLRPAELEWGTGCEGDVAEASATVEGVWREEMTLREGDRG